MDINDIYTMLVLLTIIIVRHSTTANYFTIYTIADNKNACSLYLYVICTIM